MKERLGPYERNPLRFWQVVAAVLPLLLLLSLAVHVHHGTA